MTEASRAGNLGALVQYVFFVADKDEDPNTDSSGYQSAKKFVTEASSALALDVQSASGFREHLREHLYNLQDGHELVWIQAHEAEIVILSIARSPDFKAAKTVWDEALMKVRPLIESIEPGSVQGKALALMGLGEAERLINQAETALAQPLELCAQASWGTLSAPGMEGPFLVAVKADYLQEGERFVSWEIFGYALYTVTKGLHQWRDYQAHRKELRQLEHQMERIINDAYDSVTPNRKHADEMLLDHLLQNLVTAGRAISQILEHVSRASVNIKKARSNLQQVLRGVFTTDQGLITGMKSTLLDFEEILAAEAAILRERSAELDRMTQQSQREMQLETARRSEMLLVAAHTVEFIVVLYYALASWGLVIGKHQQENIDSLWKLLWGLGVSGTAVFATYFVLRKRGERAALILLIVVVVIAVAAAWAMQWWPGPLAQIVP